MASSDYNYCEDHLTAHTTSLVSPAKIITYCFKYHFGWIPSRETGAALKAAYTGPLSDAEFQQGFLTPPLHRSAGRANPPPGP